MSLNLSSTERRFLEQDGEKDSEVTVGLMVKNRCAPLVRSALGGSREGRGRAPHWV